MPAGAGDNGTRAQRAHSRRTTRATACVRDDGAAQRARRAQQRARLRVPAVTARVRNARAVARSGHIARSGHSMREGAPAATARALNARAIGVARLRAATPTGAACDPRATTRAGDDGARVHAREQRALHAPW
eukprot:5464623-Pleurochrysis_carterae.AAC.1